jgi:hypothetical protein
VSIENSLISISENVEYLDTITNIVKFEQDNWDEYHKELDGMFWDYADVGANPQILHQLFLKGILTMPLGAGGKRKNYCLKDLKQTKIFLKELPKKKKEKEKSEKLAPNSLDIKKEYEKFDTSIFNTIVGFNDIKKVFLLSFDSLMKNDKQMHILLVGPPASAKTLFLLCLERLALSDFIIGGSSSKAGITQQLINKRPKLIMIDELEKMPKEELSVFLSLMEGGRVVERKYNRHTDMTLLANVYGSCNSIVNMPKELISRFGAFIFHFKKYTKIEFVKVCIRVLTELEEIDTDLAVYIAGKMVGITRDVRESIGVARAARVSDTPKDTVDFLVKTKQKYSNVNI